MYRNFLCLRVFFYYIQKIKINIKFTRVVLPNNEDQANYFLKIPKYSFHGPTSLWYLLAITRTICAIWVRSCTTHVEINSLTFTTPKAGWMPVNSRCTSYVI